jgi:hypothetical protein
VQISPPRGDHKRACSHPRTMTVRSALEIATGREFDRRAGPDPNVHVLVVPRGAGQAEVVMDVDQAGQHPARRVELDPRDRMSVGDHAAHDDQIPLVVVFDHAYANEQALHGPVSTPVACDQACEGDGAAGILGHRRIS